MLIINIDLTKPTAPAGVDIWLAMRDYNLGNLLKGTSTDHKHTVTAERGGRARPCRLYMEVIQIMRAGLDPGAKKSLAGSLRRSSPLENAHTHTLKHSVTHTQSEPRRGALLLIGARRTVDFLFLREFYYVLVKFFIFYFIFLLRIILWCQVWIFFKFVVDLSRLFGIYFGIKGGYFTTRRYSKVKGW